MAGKQADIKVGIVTNYDPKGLNQATTGLSGFKNSISQADGFTGKFKAGFSSLGDTISSKLQGPFGIAAIGGIFAKAGDFALDAVNKFSALGVSVGQLADATGLTADAASRWIEVAGDIGIDAGTLEGGIGKLNKALGNTPGLFTAAGIEIAKTGTGAVDVNGTLLNTIDRLKGIKNPAEKAALASKLLGKGWQSMAELVEQGSDTLKTSLEGVADAKVFDEEKVQKARDFREAMDKLKDVAEEFTIVMGTELAPALKDILGLLADLGGAWATAFGGMKDFVLGTKEAVLGIADLDGRTEELTVSLRDQMAAISETDRETRKLKPAWELAQEAIDATAEAEKEYKKNSDNTKRAVKQNIDEMIGKWAELRGDIDADQSWLTLQGQFDDVKAKAVEAWDAASTGAADSEQKTRDYQMALNDLTLDTINYAEKVKGIPPEKLVAVKALLDLGDIDRAEAMLAILTRNREINIDLVGKGAAGYAPAGTPHASGGRVGANEAWQLVGEKGPEAVKLPTGSNVIPAGQTAAMMNGSGGNTFNITVAAGADGYKAGQQIVAALKEYERRSGDDWRRVGR